MGKRNKKPKLRDPKYKLQTIRSKTTVFAWFFLEIPFLYQANNFSFNPKQLTQFNQKNTTKMFTNTKKILKSESQLLLHSSTIIGANEDIIAEILFRLPVKSVCRFKCVSKQWHSFITSPQFCQRQSGKYCKRITRLLALNQNQLDIIKRYHVFQLEKVLSGNSFPKSLSFVDDGRQMKILQSCNGLLCCRTYVRKRPLLSCGKFNYYICNPTTHQFRKLPDPVYSEFSITDGFESVLGVYLAFDPRKSPCFKVLCVYFSRTVKGYFEMEVYSSETGEWRRTGEPFVEKLDFKSGVYWNGAINWLNSSSSGDGLYFHVDEERLGKLPMISIPGNDIPDNNMAMYLELNMYFGLIRRRRKIMYFGESYDHLYLVEYDTDLTSTQFNMSEMDREYSGWSIRYHVDVEAVMEEFMKPAASRYHSFEILSIVCGQNDEDSFVVLSIDSKVVRYNLGNKSFEKIQDFGESEGTYLIPTFRWNETFQYIESMYTV